MTSKQTPCQVGECPSGAPRNVPSASTLESTPPQCGVGMKASPKDPLKEATNYRSTGWRKDLEHVLKVYYKHNFTSFKEADWAKLKDKFFGYLLQHQDEWRSIKENHPLQYVPYMEKHFHATTGIRLKGLSDFTGWIKRDSYYHALVAKKGQLHKCPHLAGVEPPRWLQVTPSKSHQVSQRREETPTPSPHTPSQEASMAQGAWSDIPAPMETGGVGDGRSWVDRAEASADDEFRRDRPMKHCQSALRRWEGWPTLPFPLQDNAGRCTSVQQLYQHAGEQPWACHNVATQGLTHQYPDMEPCKARSLGNQVLCMIAEYHLTGLVQGSSSVSPVLPGTLEAAQHGKGPLLELLLAPMTSSLTFAEVVECVLAENWHRVESSLDDLQGHCAQLQGELDDLIEDCKRESLKSSRRRIKKEIDLTRKHLESLSVAIPQRESSLGREQEQPEETTTSDDNSSDHGAEEAEEAEMAITPVANDTPPVSTTTHLPDPPPVEEQTMEVDDGNDGQPLASPVSPREDEILTGGGAVGVEGEMANLTVSSPRGQNGGDEDASI